MILLKNSVCTSRSVEIEGYIPAKCAQNQFSNVVDRLDLLIIVENDDVAGEVW